MKVQYISSACVLIEHGGVRILCDPWLTDGIYYGSWYHYPILTVSPEDFNDVDYIYLSHVHPDHSDVASLKRLRRDIPVLILEYEEKFLLRMIKQAGFENVIEVPHRLSFQFTPNFSIEIFAADNCDPTLCERWWSCQYAGQPSRTLQIDSLAVFSGGERIVVNNNDCPFPLSKGVCEYIMQKYGSVDFLLTGYMGAGPYPQCFDHFDEKTKLEKAETKKKQFLNQAISYIKALKPTYFLPFAGQYTLGGGLHSLNPFRGLPELEDLSELFPPLLHQHGLASQMTLLNSREWFDVELEQTSAPFEPPDPKQREQYVQSVLSKKKYSYEISSPPSFDSFQEPLSLAHEHMRKKQKQYDFFTDTKVYLDIGEDRFYCIPFNDNGVVQSVREMQQPFVRIRLHPGLLEMILKREAHWNNAEIGSHLSLYRDPEKFERGIYHFLSYLN
jgi:UDP-MurNAc hydroxylase